MAPWGYQQMAASLPAHPAPLELDANADGAFTISDLVPWLERVYFLPGDWLIWLLLRRAAGIASFLEIGTSDYGSLLAGFLSACVWFVLLIAALLAYHWVNAVDDLLTRSLRDACGLLLRRARVWLQLAKHRLSQGRSRKPAPQVDLSMEFDLSELEFRALVAVSAVVPPYALCVSDVAEAVGEDRRHTRALLEKLKGLGLLNRSIGGADGEDAYQASQSGRAFVVFQQLSS